MWKFGIKTRPGLLPALFLFISGISCIAQTPPGFILGADFTAPDTVCVNTPVTITNLTQGASTWFWKFCPGTPLSNPYGIPSGFLLGTLAMPMGITLAQDGNNYYAFITNSGASSIVRVKWISSLVNSPTYEILNTPGVLTQDIRGIRVISAAGNWHAFVTNGSSLVRLDFGSTLDNLSPIVSTAVNSPLMNKAQGLVIGYDGTGYIGFCTNYPAQTITRFAWGTSLTSTPVVTDLGNIGGLTRPMQPCLIADSSGWHMFVSNTTSMVQVKFGSSLMNTPVGTNLGNLVWITDNRGVTSYTQCSIPYVLVSNHDVVVNQLFQAHFPQGLDGPKTLTPLGSVGGQFETVSLSETLSSGDTIFCVALNAYPSLSTLYFLPCQNSTIPNSTQFDPSPVIFPDPGTYTIVLKVDDGLPTEQEVCREIEVVSPSVNLGADTSICEGTAVVLDAGSGQASYLWNTGDTTQTITVDTTGTFSVNITDKFGCVSSDSTNVSLKLNSYSTVDTTICFGQTYLAGGVYQSVTGTYYDTTTSSNGCRLFTTTNLTVDPEILVNLGPDTCITGDTTIVLHAQASAADAYLWQDGSQDSVLWISSAGAYWVRVTVRNCSSSDSITITRCPVQVFFYLPGAFTPNGDGLNDVFRPVANEIVKFHLAIYDRWGELIFETSDLQQGWNGMFKGSYCEPGEYLYVLDWEDGENAGVTRQMKGMVTLIR